MNTQTIAISSQIGLEMAGKNVLLIDKSLQGSLTISLGNPQPGRRLLWGTK